MGKHSIYPYYEVSVGPGSFDSCSGTKTSRFRDTRVAAWLRTLRFLGDFIRFPGPKQEGMPS